MTSRYEVTLVVDHDPEVSREEIAAAIAPALSGTWIPFGRKPSTTDARVRNPAIDPRTLCFSATVNVVTVHG